MKPGHMRSTNTLGRVLPVEADEIRSGWPARRGSSPLDPLVLIVEDEPAQAEMLRYNLESEGFRTIAAAE